MRTIQLKGNNTAVLYDSIYDLPEGRYHEFNKFSLFDLGLGGDMEAINRHHEALDSYLKNQRFEDAVQERLNMHIGYFYQIEKINPKSLCFGCFIERINGEPMSDKITHDVLRDKIRMLSKMGLKHGQVSDTLEDIKKNLKQSLGFAFLNDTETMKSLVTSAA